MVGHFYSSTHLLLAFFNPTIKIKIIYQFKFSITTVINKKEQKQSQLRCPLSKTLGKIWSPLSFLGLTRSHQQLANHYLPKSQREVVDARRATQKVCNPSKKEAEHTYFCKAFV